MAIGDQVLDEAKAAYERNDLSTADRLCTQFLANNPISVPGTILRALVFARTGKRAAAIVYLQNAVRRAPDSFEAHVALSTLLFSAGNQEEAISHGRKAISLKPDDPDSYAHLARDLRIHKRPIEALDLFRKAAELAPERVFLHRELAELLTELGIEYEAMKEWEQVLILAPKELDCWLELGRLCLAKPDIDKAISCGRGAVRADEKSADAHFLLGLALSEKGLTNEAETHVVRSIELNPDLPLAHATLGLILNEQGRFEEARPSLEKSIELWPTNGLAFNTLLRTRKVTAYDEPLLEHIESLTAHPDANQLSRSYMHYALGKAKEDLRDFERAMSHYDAANALAHEFWFASKPWDRKRYQFNFDRTIETFTLDKMLDLSPRSLDSQVPIFVVGMIRSGTTLVEHILSSHPSISAGGELTYWHEHADEIFDPSKSAVKENRLAEVAGGYLELLDGLGQGAPRVTDKLPHNFALMGLISSALPNARFVHVRRNPVDNCLSVYTTAYPHPPAFALRRSNIVFAYRAYQRMMAHWRTIMAPDRLLEIDYEELIGNRDEVAQRMIAFAGLEWDERCLHHERNERSVHTPSVWQVRQPIYKTSVDRWRNFEPWIAEFASLHEDQSF